MELRDKLALDRRAVLNQIRALEGGAALASQLEQIDYALKGFPTDREFIPDEFEHLSAQHAIIKYLKLTRRAATKDVISETVVAYGFKGSGSRWKPVSDCKRAFFHMMNANMLRQVGELYGLPEWSDDKFRP